MTKTNLMMYFLLAAALVASGTLVAQDRAAENVALPPGQPAVARSPMFNNQNPISGFFSGPRLPGQTSEMTQAMRDLRDADSADEKQAARDELKKQLEKQYDAYLAQNEKQLKQLEERLEKLREQLGKRREAKAKLVDLRLQMLESEADGLGWPGSDFGRIAPPQPAFPSGAGPNPNSPWRPAPPADSINPRPNRPTGFPADRKTGPAKDRR